MVARRAGARRALQLTHARIARRPAGPDESPATAYYAAWLDALEALLAERER